MKTNSAEKFERLDDTGFGDIKIWQNINDFCYGIDAVILADFVSKYKKIKSDILVDFCSGNGIIPLILSHKSHIGKIIGLEFQKQAVTLAERNIELNNLKEKIKVVHGDVLNTNVLLSYFHNKVDIVSINPPYFKCNENLLNKDESKTLARHETTAGLEDFIENAHFLLKERGELFLIHRPERLVSIISYMRKFKIEPKIIRFVAPYKNKNPNLVLIKGIKNAGEELKVLDNLYVYDENGKYTDEIQEIYERK